MILVTGFWPYKEVFNASGELIESLKSDLPQELESIKDELVFEVLSCDITSRETEHQTLEAKLLELLELYQPEMCIFTGQAPAYNRVTIEKIGINSFMSEKIDPQRPAAFWSNLHGLDELQTELEKQEIPTDYSYNAGQSLCNHILYSSLYFAEAMNLSHNSVFIHIPVLPKQIISTHPKSACMPLDMTRKALTIIITHAMKQRVKLE
ncbi:hypothetical protein [Thiomicrorhabdus sp.]|uniref:pyroglutamyl-peptidase I family protein n=1 Tax=Thiomicrorhabdus sp. TaxID=2039724 RepID=UPI0029C67B3C|nr:hypothetical protein [Thiomicrorhabdus sp.]